MAMAHLTTEDLKGWPYFYDSPRDVGDVLIGEDTARLLIEASSSGSDTAVQSLLLKPEMIKTMLEINHRIYEETRPSQGPNDVREVSARPESSLEHASNLAARNGHAAVVSTLLTFATQHGITASDIFHKTRMFKIIQGGYAAVIRAIASADPTIVHMRLGHGGTLPIYEAVRLRQTDVAAVLLKFGADPLHPVLDRKLGTSGSSLMSHAALSRDPRMTEILLEHGIPIVGSSALHTAARCGDLDTMRLLMQYGAEVNEVISRWRSWTPMHFAASNGQVDTMKWLEQNGARSDLRDSEQSTSAQLLETFNTSEH